MKKLNIAFLRDRTRFSKLLSTLLALLTLFAMPACHAQEYRLGTDDVLSVTVLRHPEYSVAQMTVPSSGKIQVPGAGSIVVTNKTTAQVESEIAKRLSKTLLRPNVTVSLTSQRALKVFILGSVNKPGAYEIKPGWRITEALALAGGLTVLPEQVDATLSRPNQKAVPLNSVRLFSNSAGPANLILRNGDVLRFKERVVRINVAGQVQKPGNYDVRIGSDIVEAIAVAGGATPRAALTRVNVRRINGEQISIDLYKAIVQGQGTNNLKLREGDLVLVPEVTERVAILGAVQKPGFYDIQDGTTLRVADAIALSGGFNERAALSRARIRRADGTESPVDLYKVTRLGLQDGNVTLTPGDSVVIPEMRGITVLGAVAKPGTYYLDEGSDPRVSDALAAAGGLNIKPELARLSIAHSQQSTTSTAIAPVAETNTDETTAAAPSVAAVNPVALLEFNELSQNKPVRDGDIITISAIKIKTVFIGGEVATPGAYELKEGDSLPALIARAGGTTGKAALRQTTITRRSGQAQTVDMFSAVREGKAVNVALEEGDYVVVPENKALVLVTPGVKTPGMYPVPEDRPLTIGEALSLAGGPVDRAKLHEVVVIRQTPTGTQKRVLSLKGEVNGQPVVNLALQGGDVLYVPPGGRQNPTALDLLTRAIPFLF